MTITFKTEALIAAAQKAIDNHADDLMVYEARKNSLLAEHRAAWVAERREGVVRLRDALTKALKSAGPIEISAIRKAANDGNDIEHLFYTAPGSYEINNAIGNKPEAYGIKSYAGLIELLKAHTGETITANQLKVLGYDKLTGLFTDAVRAGGESK